MNDKEKLLRNYVRMCLSPNCYDCPIGRKGGFDEGCNRWVYKHLEEAAEIIKKWASEHPVKTRQSVFLEQYPYAELIKKGNYAGTLDIPPCRIDSKHIPCGGELCKSNSCRECSEEYWSQEVADE